MFLFRLLVLQNALFGGNFMAFVSETVLAGFLPMRKNFLKEFWIEQSDVAALYASAFFQSFAGAIWLVVMPFIIKRLGGSDFQVGLCTGLLFAGYVTSLLLSRHLLDRFDFKKSSQLAAAAIAAATAASCLIVFLAEKGLGRNTAVPILIAGAAGAGAMTVLFWPQLVGWLSKGHEGPQLNRRLGIFNLSWSLGGIISPYVGGQLVEAGSVIALAAAAVIMFLSFLSIFFARPPAAAATDIENNGDKKILHPLLHRRFMWASRIALLTVFICMGLARTQLAMLFKFNLSFSEADYGIVIVIMNLTSFVVFLAATRSHAWHYIRWLFFGQQLLLILSMLVILNCTGFPQLAMATAMVGGSQAFIYSSHLYYAISGSSRRSGQMAVHEITLSLGMIIGSLFGGYLSDHFTRYTPYWFGFAAVLIGLAAQSAIWFSSGDDSNYKMR